MKTRSLSHLSDDAVSHGFHSRVARDHPSTAELLQYLGEYDTRKLWARAGYASMFGYCVEGLHMSDDVALVRIRAARALRDFPVLFEAVAEGRLHLSAVLMLKPHLTPETVDELVAAATHRTKAEIERLLAARFPRPDVLTVVRAISPRSQALTANELAPERVGVGEQLVPERVGVDQQLVPERVGVDQQLVPERVWNGELRVEALPAAPVPAFQSRAKVTPLAPERFALQVTISQRTHDKLRRAQELLSHTLPSGNVAEVLDRALDALIHELEKRKFAATTKPRANARASENPRHIPAHVKRAVMKRDGGRCTFVSDTGVRCSSRKFIEFDHIHEVARGGVATIATIRLRCRAHNQFAAECTFGAGFMDEKRRAAAEAKKAAPEQPTGEALAASNRRLHANADEREAGSSVESGSKRSASRESSEMPSLAETFARARLNAAFGAPAPASPRTAATTCTGPGSGSTAFPPAVRACSD